MKVTANAESWIDPAHLLTYEDNKEDNNYRNIHTMPAQTRIEATTGNIYIDLDSLAQKGSFHFFPHIQVGIGREAGEEKEEKM